MQVCEHWAFQARPRAGQLHPPVQAEIVSLSRGRVRVRWAAGEQYGELAWVRTADLHVPWVDVDAWVQDQQAWDQLEMELRPVDLAARWALTMCTQPLQIRADALAGGEGHALRLRHPEQDLELIDLDLAELLSLPGAHISRLGHYRGPWAAATLLSRACVRHDPDSVLNAVASAEERCRRGLLWGEAVPGPGQVRRRPPDFFRNELRERVDPGAQLIRSWCSAADTDRFDELVALREELMRVGVLAERAIAELENAGARRTAKTLRRELGVRIDASNETAIAIGP